MQSTPARRARSRAPSAVLLLVAGVFALGSCKACNTTAKPKGNLALTPVDADLVFSLNVARVRDTPIWRRVLDLRDQSPQTKAALDDITQKSGIDPFKQIDALFLAFPSDPAQMKAGEFGVIVRGGPFDENKLAAYAREEVTKRGGQLTSTDYDGKKVWADNAEGLTQVSVLDQKTVLVGGKGWIRWMLDLATKAKPPKGSANQNQALMALVKQAHTKDAFWGAGVVPEDVRKHLKDDPRLAAAATMQTVYGSADFANGLVVNGVVQLGTEKDAAALASTLNDQLTALKGNPQLMVSGMVQFVNAVKVSSKGKDFMLDVNLTQQQVDDLITRVEGLLKSVGAAIPQHP